MQDLTTGPITRHLLKTTGFMLVTMLFQTLYFLIDLYWVGRLGTAAVAAVGIAGNLTFIVLALTQMLGVGTTAVISHAVGRKDAPQAVMLFNQAQVLAMLGSQRCVVITHQKGRNTKENVMRNFGSAHPEGYRKALRLMRLGEKFGIPVISLIDTPGAFPGIGSEERHISEAIAVNLREMMRLRVPIIAAVIGEGGSGGALGIGVADRVLILENAYYSVISPEACSAILWRDRKHAPEAAEALKLTGQDLLKLDVVDEIVDEPEGGAHRDYETAAANLGGALRKNLEKLREQPIDSCSKNATKNSAVSAISDRKSV